MGPSELNNVRKTPLQKCRGSFIGLDGGRGGLVHESAQGLVLPFTKYQYFQLKKGTKKAKYYTSTKTSKTIKKLAKKKTYSVKIRSYKKISGKTYYGAWSGTKKVKIK